MAANKILSIRQLPLLIPSTCWNAAQRNYVKESTLLKKMGLPEKPKRPPTGFIKFVSSMRPLVLEKNPNISFTEISILLGKQWKALPGAERQKYSDEYQKQFAAYKIKLEEYNKRLTKEQKEELEHLKAEYVALKKENEIMNSVKKMEKKLKKPKNPGSPFVLYCNKNSDSFQGLKGSERIKKSAEKWNNLSETEKHKYKALFEKEYEQYKKDLQKWEEQMVQQGNLDLVRLKTLKQKLQNAK